MKKLFNFLLPALMMVSALAGCGGGSKMHDYVHDGSVKLGLNYAGKDFYKDGIVQVTLETAIDGDTAHFRPLTGTTTKIKSRFYGIDTPESTGSVEPYGFAASRFTKTKLKHFSENGTIVVSTPGDGYGAPEPDSTGSRYVSMIWVSEKKNCPYNELVSLNLWVVQEGLSLVKDLDKMPQYAETFDAAEEQARKLKLNMFSGLDDPEYNYGDYEDLSLLEVAHEIQAGLDDPEYEYTFTNKKIHFTGTVGGFSGGTLYLQKFFTFDEGSEKEEGEFVAVNVYTGMGGTPGRFTVPNTYVEIYGLITNSENFGFQISDAYFPTWSSDEETRSCKVLLKADKNTVDPTYRNPETGEAGHMLHTFTVTADELSDAVVNKDYSMLFSPVTVTDELTCVESYHGRAGWVNTYNSEDGDTSLAFDGCDWGVYIKEFQYQPYKGDEEKESIVWPTCDMFIGKRFTVQDSVLAYFKSPSSGKYTYQLYLSDSYGLTYLEA